MRGRCFIMNNYDNLEYRKFTKKSELDRVLNTLQGIISGIKLDSKLNIKELEELKNWCNIYRDYINIHPFNELIPLIDTALEDNQLTEDEILDIMWLCDKLKTGSKFYDATTVGIQKLEGMLHGILADNIITDEEIINLKGWIEDHEYLAGCYPYDEIYSLLISILSDGVITNDERNLLKVFFSEFVDLKTSKNINAKELEELKKEFTIQGICAIAPEIKFENNKFCFTGASNKTTREGFKNIVTSLNGNFSTSISSKTNYLVIGNEGNPCWAYSCYGRKVEDAIKLRKNGHKILIIHENDFWDCIDDLA